MFIGAGNQVGCRTCCNLCRNVIPEVRVTGILYEFYLYTSSSFNTVNRSFKSLLFILSPDADGNSFSIRFSLLGFYYCSGVTCFSADSTGASLWVPAFPHAVRQSIVAAIDNAITFLKWVFHSFPSFLLGTELYLPCKPNYRCKNPAKNQTNF